MIWYVDSSALMRRYIKSRKGSAETDAELAGATLIATATLTRVEVAASLRRCERGGQIPSGSSVRLIHALEADLALMWRIPVNDLVLERAANLAAVHFLKGYDAVHLAAASVWRAALGQPTTVMTFDAELWKAAQAEGFTPWPEELTLFR